MKLRRFSRFAKCSKCIGLKESITKNLVASTRNYYKKKLKDHVNFIRQQRLCYYAKRYQAKTNKDCMSIIIDGSDMQNYGIPYFYDITKESSTGFKIPYKLYGAIVHGLKTYAFVINKHWGGDCNIIIQILHEIIHRTNPRDMKKTLYLQVYYIYFICFNLI